MNLVNKENVALFQIGQQRRKIPGLFQHRAGGGLYGTAHFIGDDVGQRRLTKSWRTEDQDVIQSLAAALAAPTKISICSLTVG